MAKCKHKKYPSNNKGRPYKIAKLDDFFTPEELPKDVFGFLTSISDVETEGFFAVFDLGDKVKATEIYSQETLKKTGL